MCVDTSGSPVALCVPNIFCDMDRGGQRRNRPFNNFEESMIHTQVSAGLPGLNHSDQPCHPAPHLCWKTAASSRVGVFLTKLTLPGTLESVCLKAAFLWWEGLPAGREAFSSPWRGRRGRVVRKATGSPLCSTFSLQGAVDTDVINRGALKNNTGIFHNRGRWSP